MIISNTIVPCRTLFTNKHSLGKTVNGNKSTNTVDIFMKFLSKLRWIKEKKKNGTLTYVCLVTNEIL